MNPQPFPVRRTIHPTRALRAFLRRVSMLAALLVVGLALAPGASLPPLAHAAAPSAPEASIPFVPGALGSLSSPAALYDAPFDGRALEMLPVGARVAVGGEVRKQGVLRAKRSYWVEVEDASGRRFGFLRAGAVVVTAGRVAPLDVAGLPARALLAPAGVAPVAATSVTSAAPMAVLASTSASGVPSGLPGVATARLSIGWLPDTVLAWRSEIEAAAARHGLSPDLVAIVILVESGGDPSAMSPSGARGLMQVMPGTGRDIAQRRGIAGFEPADLHDPATAIDFGTWYLAGQLAAFGDKADLHGPRSIALAAAAYNGGPAHVGQHLTTGQPLFAETSRYQRWVGGMWRERGQNASASYEAWWNAGGHRLVQAARAQAVR